LVEFYVAIIVLNELKGDRKIAIARTDEPSIFDPAYDFRNAKLPFLGTSRLIREMAESESSTY
jgi:hypothetical protein